MPSPAPVVRPVDEDADWSTDTSGRPVLRVSADLPDAPARYLLTVHSDRVDPCLSVCRDHRPRPGRPVDCGARRGCNRRATSPASRRSRSTTSPRTSRASSPALSNFSAARYPLWAERSEADFGVMLMEALSALADELSYLQDRVAAEATIGTATQRLSLVRHARLVDYEPMPALAASTVLQFDVAPAEPGADGAAGRDPGPGPRRPGRDGRLRRGPRVRHSALGSPVPAGSAPAARPGRALEPL